MQATLAAYGCGAPDPAPTRSTATPVPPNLYSSPYFAAHAPREFEVPTRLIHPSFVTTLGTYPEYLALSSVTRREMAKNLLEKVFGGATLEATQRTVLHAAQRTDVEARP
jgi:hypothetical protein